MKRIVKKNEPNSLTEYRAKGGVFNSLPTETKEDIRESLLSEQGHICCYCMKRIPQKLKQEEIERNFPTSKIEHVQCQKNHTDLELNYKNLLLACNGNHGHPRIMQTCDTFKGEIDLSFNPSNLARDIENLIKYRANGEIYSDDVQINNELIESLNLNTKDLKDTREIIYKNINSRIILEGKNRGNKAIQKKFYEAEKEKLLTRANDKFIEYCMVGVYLLNKKLNKMI